MDLLENTGLSCQWNGSMTSPVERGHCPITHMKIVEEGPRGMDMEGGGGPNFVQTYERLSIQSAASSSAKSS